MVRVLCVCASTCSGPAALPRAASARPPWRRKCLRPGPGVWLWSCMVSPGRSMGEGLGGCGMLCRRSICSDRTRLEYVREQPRFGLHHGLVFARLQGHGLGAQLQEACPDGRQCQQMVDFPVHALDPFGRDMAWRVDAEQGVGVDILEAQFGEG